MTVTQAASKGLEVLLAGSFIKSQEWRRENGYEREGTWQDYLRDEFVNNSYDDDEEPDFDNLDEQRVWQHAKYEASGPYTIDGFTAKVEAQYGGEGEGDQYWMVISISDGNTTRYFRRDGWYASYDGGYLDGDTYEVSPKEKVITVYES